MKICRVNHCYLGRFVSFSNCHLLWCTLGQREVDILFVMCISHYYIYNKFSWFKYLILKCQVFGQYDVRVPNLITCNFGDIYIWMVNIIVNRVVLLIISKFENAGVPNSSGNFRVIVLVPLPNYYPFTWSLYIYYLLAITLISPIDLPFTKTNTSIYEPYWKSP